MAALHALSLVVHLLCLAVYGAASIGGPLLDRALWSAAERGRNAEALTLARTAMHMGRFAQMAAVLTLLSGVGMLASTSFVQWGQPWLYGKVALFVALGACGGAIGGRGGRRLVAALSERAAAADGAASGIHGELAKLRSTFATFHVVMLAMLVAVVALAAIRP